MLSKRSKIACRMHACFEKIAIVSTSTLLIIVSGCKEGPPRPPGNSDQLTDPTVQPRVIFTYPSNNGIGPFNVFNRAEGYLEPHFVARFNKLMRKSSVTPSSVTCQGFDRPVRVTLFERPIYPYRRRAESTSDDDFYSDLLSFRIHESLYFYGVIPYGVGSN